MDVVPVDRLGEAEADAVLDLWARHGALGGADAQQRLAEVVCLLVDEGGAVRGVSSAGDAAVGMLGEQRLWSYRRFVPEELGSGYDTAMLVTAFDVLARRFEQDGGPIGVCVVVDADTATRFPQAVWPDTGLFHAGFTAQGEQLRVRYFDGARL